ncbi:MAG: response regulator [Pseudobdellovibrionaceae bacterium]|nr:response regulator [Pseudobdellovibrionaceae bacterium]
MSRVVVIDDDEGTVEIIAAFLSEIPSVSSRVYTSPRILLNELSTMTACEYPRLVFSDILMPDFNGLQMIDEITAIGRARGLLMPQMIFISGRIEDRSQGDDLVRTIRERGYQTLAKPFRMETILQVARDALGL